MTDVSVIGTGLMGAAATRSLLRSGRTVTVWNRTAASAQPLAGDGAVVAASASEAFGASPVTIIVIRGYDAVLELVEAARSEGRLGDVINLTTGTPGDADELAEWAASHGVPLLDGAIFGFPTDMGTAHLPIMCAGDKAVFDRHQPLITTLGGASQHLGAPERLANALDVSMLTVVNATIVATMEGLAVGLAHDIYAGVLVGLFQGVLATQAAALGDAAAAIDGGRHAVDDATITTWKGGASAVVRAAADIGVRSRMAEAALATLDDVEAAGLGQSGITAIVEQRLTAARPAGAP